MNIPQKYLMNNSLSEQKKKFYEKLTNRYSRACSEYRKKNNTDSFDDKLIKWLFNQKEETRMILCSVENKKYTNTIHEAYTNYTEHSEKIKFRITDEDDGYGEKYKIESTIYYDKNKSDSNFEEKNNYFLNNVAFYQCESPIDEIDNYSSYFTLRPEILRNSENFKEVCKTLSYNKFLSSPIMIKKEIQSKTIIFFKLPNWINLDNNENCTGGSNEKNNNSKTHYTLSQYILALIEQVLSIRYLLFYESKDLKEIISSTYLNDLFTRRTLMLSYMNTLKIETKMFYSYFNIADINSRVFYDQDIEKFIQEKKNYISEYSYNKDISLDSDLELDSHFYRDNVKTIAYDSEIIFESISKKNKNNKEEFYLEVINLCIFFPINKLYTLDDFFLRLTFEKIFEEYSKKICDDLITGNEEKPKKKKKKKKKNNKNNKNINNTNDNMNNKENEKNIQNEIINEINENNIENIKNEIYSFIKKLIMDELDRKIKEKIKNEMIINNNKNKKNKKEKGFFLYEPVKKKEKKKSNTKNNKNVNGNKDSKNTINNIKEDDIKSNNNIIQNNNIINDDISNNNKNINENLIIENKDIKKSNNNIIISNNSSIPSHINSFTLCSSNNSSTSSDSINHNNNIIKANEQIDNINNLFVVHQNPIMISYEKINKLTEDINTFNKDLKTLLLIIREIKIEIRHHFESIIKKIYGKNARIEIFGSSSYQLDIESSDLDLSISTKSKLELDCLAEYLLNNNNNQQYLNVNPIYTASIPVIKLDIDYLKLNNDKIKDLHHTLINNDYYKICINNNFYKNFNIIKVDISMNSIKYKQIHFIKKEVNHYPQIKPLIKILKKLLILKNMNNSYKGGMGSYCLFLIIYSYLRMHNSFYANSNNDFNYGSLLIGFLFHYVMCIDFKYTIINPCLANPFIISNCPIDIIPTIIDPITMNNAGKTIYKILDVVNALNEIYRDIFVIIKEDKNDENLIYKYFKKYLENEK